MKLMKFCLLSIIIFLLYGCIGDKMVIVRYQVNNKSEDTLYVHGSIVTLKQFEPQQDSLYIIKPNARQVVHASQKICWFGDCRGQFKTDTILDSLKIFRNTFNSKLVNIDKSEWKLKKAKAIFKIK